MKANLSLGIYKPNLLMCNQGAAVRGGTAKFKSPTLEPQLNELHHNLVISKATGLL